MNTLGTICAIGWFAVSFTFYVITMGVGWALDQMVFPNNTTIRAAAVISTIPVIAVIGYIIIIAMFGSDNVNPCAGFCMIACLLLAGLFEFIGGIIFIAAGAQAGDARILAFGASAGVFGILAGCSCCWSLSACSAAFTDKKDDHGGGGEES